MSTEPVTTADVVRPGRDGATVAAVVLAAGRGTRFRSATSKVLHRAAGRTLLGHVLGAIAGTDVDRVLVVVGPDAADVEAEVAAWDVRLPQPVTTVVQVAQLGTGDALDVALGALPTDVTRVLVVPGDTPLLRADTLAALLAADAAAPLVMLTTVLDDATGYGRVLRDASGGVIGVVEQRDATEAQLAVDEVNAGMYVLDRAVVQPLVAALGTDNAQGERYLTDVVAQLGRAGGAVAVTAPAEEVAGVNDRVQLAEAAGLLRRRHLDALMRDGVSVVDPAQTYVDVDVQVGIDTTLLPGTILEGTTRIGAGATVGPSCHLTDCEVGDGAVVHSTRADGARIGAGVDVGPFAHLRPGTVLGEGARVGAFVQTKNATVGAGAKVPHLAYVGDADVGAGANVACGVVTVNYDGRDKHRTVIGEGAFVGCGTMLVAPVTIGDGAFVGAGSTITEDVPPEALAIARARQVVKEGRARGRLG
jgi:bifunctional UDP-N-acetylglucosamine pyrophosphorylase / glucosamine-1-phosphate N-acetyltransferase